MNLSRVPPGDSVRGDSLRYLEKSITSIREICSWCTIYTSSYGLDSNGLDINADLINIVKGTYEYFAIIHGFCSDNSLSGLAEARASFYIGRIQKIEPYVTSIHSLFYKWAIANSLSSQLQDFHSRRYLDHLSHLLGYALELQIKENMMIPTFLSSVPPSNQHAIVAIDQYFNAARYSVTSEIEFFWSKNFSNNFYTSCENFMNCLEVYLNYHISSKDKDVIKSTLDSCTTNLITAAMFNDFVKVYAANPSFTIKGAIDNLIFLSKFSWFCGFMGRETANSILLHQPAGTFLIRFSSSRPTDFALNYMSTDSIVKSHSIVSVEGKGFFLGNHTYGSLSDLVTCNISILNKPVLTKIGYLKYFHGFIDYEESKNLLLSHSVGTFLMRFSHSKPGCVVIAWVVKKGDVKQSIVGTDLKNGGYVLGTGSESEYFRCLDDIVDKMSDVLKFACPFSITQHISDSPLTPPNSNSGVDSRGYSLRVSGPAGGEGTKGESISSAPPLTRHNHSASEGDEEGNFALKKAQAISSDLSNAGPRLRNETSDLDVSNKKPKRSDSKSPYDEKLCVVCYHNNKTVVLLPCKHLCVCEGCSLNPLLNSCPLCRTIIKEKQTVFL